MDTAQSLLIMMLALLTNVALVLAVALVILLEARLAMQLWRGLTAGSRERWRHGGHAAGAQGRGSEHRSSKARELSYPPRSRSTPPDARGTNSAEME